MSESREIKSATPGGETIARRVAEIIVERLQLEQFSAETLPHDAILFAATHEGGLDLDSIASLEIVSALSDEYDLDFDNIARDDFMSVETLANYISRERGGSERESGEK